ncbi:MAG: type II toxin-antitoxin system ParD family antitoxin [Phyllobacteriaceae bacterium]|nr:type II toxin-antitoxin system ParD family antitoxin [Phyllobacteriaceae bacterium]
MSKPAEKLSVTITAPMAERIRAEVEAGHYGSTSEVIREALRLWEKQQQELDLLRARVKASIEDPRPRVPIKEAFERIRKRAEEYKAENSDEAA